MGKVLCFIGAEKSLSNILKYNFFEKLFNNQIKIITTSTIAKGYESKIELTNYTSNWTPSDIDTFHLHLLFRNFLTRNNKALNYELRNRIFGPYKIRRIQDILLASKYFWNSITKIKWLLLFRNLFKSCHQMLFDLRKSRAISEGDYSSLIKILEENKITAAISITPFRDPKIYDLAEACHALNIPLHIFTECWDNVSSGYGIPSYISGLHLWSAQQLQEISKFYPQYALKSEIIGSYRRSYALDFQQEVRLNDGEFNILYLEGYFYENLNYTINTIQEALVKSNLILTKNKINLIVRRYPLKRQSIDVIEEENWIRTININQCTISVSTSKLIDLNDEFFNTNLVISELTTAGLEAQFRNIPTFFIGSHSSPRFLDSAAGYNFPFAHLIKESDFFFNLSVEKDINRLINGLHNLSDNHLRNDKALELSEKINFYAEPFNLTKWNILINKLSK